MPNPSEFTPNQVAALLEEMKGQFQAVAEAVEPLHDDMILVKENLEKIEGRLGSLETKVDSLEDAVRLAIPDHAKRLNILEKKLSA